MIYRANAGRNTLATNSCSLNVAMKNCLIALLLTFVCGSTSAQLFSGEAGQGALLGGLVGGIIGHNSNRRTMEGVGIGAGAGWLLGTLSREHRNRGSYDSYIPSRRRSVYADTAPIYRRPNHAVSGAVVGAVAGGIIGHNQGRQTLEGIGIGAATGLAVGGIAEHITRRRETRHYFAHEAKPILIPNSRFYRNPTPPPSGETVVPEKPNRRLPQQRQIFERIKSSRTSNRGRPRQVVRPVQVQQPRTVIINNYYLSSPPVSTNQPVVEQKSAGR